LHTTKIQHIKGYYQTFLQLFSNYFNNNAPLVDNEAVTG